MTIICINTKNYSLTLNAKYDILAENDTYYTLRNDKDKVVQYSKKLFKTEEVMVPPPAPRVQPVRIRTERDLINQIEINVEDNIFTISVPRITGDLRVETEWGLSKVQSEISCGISEIDFIQTLCENIDHLVNQITDEDDFINLRKSIFKKVILKTHEQTNDVDEYTIFTIISIVKSDEFEDYYSILDELCEIVTDWSENPNSENEIKVWVIKEQ